MEGGLQEELVEYEFRCLLLNSLNRLPKCRIMISLNTEISPQCQSQHLKSRKTGTCDKPKICRQVE